MILGYTIIYVENVLETLHFYERVFGLEIKFIHETEQYGELNTGETTLAFLYEKYAHKNVSEFKVNRPINLSPGFQVAFVVKDVHKVFEKALKGGATAILDPELKPWGQTVAYLKDLNGIIVEICTRI